VQSFKEAIDRRDGYGRRMKTLSQVVLAGLVILGFATGEALGQPMSAQAALAEFALVGSWAPSCTAPTVVLTFKSGATSQFVVRLDKDGARFDIKSATKLGSDLATLELRPISFFKDGRWQAASAAYAQQVLQYAFGKNGNSLVSTWESQLRIGVPAGLYSKCATLGALVSPPPQRQFPPPPRP
jgi:hypothetical protein